MSVSESVSPLQAEDEAGRRRGVENTADILLKPADQGILKSFLEDETQASRPMAVKASLPVSELPSGGDSYHLTLPSAGFISQSPPGSPF